MQGKIIKGIAGFYYVHTVSGIYECKAKGIFRKDSIKPLVGDDVELQVLDEQEKVGNVTDILPRRSQLIRPAVANVDQALVVFALTSPKPNFNLLDRFLIMMRQQNIPCIICFNKLDLDKEESGECYRAIYEACGYPTLLISTQESVGIDRVRELLKGHTTTVAGPSGVGKSSLINSLQDATTMEIGAVSEKIERGRHTTRHSELIPVEDGYILDTPGFSSLGVFDMEKEDLAAFYPEFTEAEKSCRFGGCAHINEPDCGVKEALAAGRISSLRYENYCQIYEELRLRKRY